MTTGSLTKAQFLARVNEYCRLSWARMLERFASYKEQKGPDVSEERLFIGATWRFLLPGIEFQFDEMRNIGAPQGDEAQVEEMVGEMQIAIESGEKQRISSAEQLVSLFELYNPLARQYGIDDCLVREAALIQA